MENNIDFTVYCIEEYKNAKNLTGKKVIEIFNKYGVIEYIDKHYQSLHTTGANYIVEDIDLFLKTKGL